MLTVRKAKHFISITQKTFETRRRSCSTWGARTSILGTRSSVCLSMCHGALPDAKVNESCMICNISEAAKMALSARKDLRAKLPHLRCSASHHIMVIILNKIHIRSHVNPIPSCKTCRQHSSSRKMHICVFSWIKPWIAEA